MIQATGPALVARPASEPAGRPAFALWLAVALAAGVASPLGAAPDESARLRALERRYEVHLRSERPDLATRLGMKGVDGRLEPVTEASMQRDALLLDVLADSARALGAERLSGDQRARLDTLRLRIERERAPLADGSWRTDPSRYLALAHGAVMDAAGSRHGSPCTRIRRAASRLRLVPEVLRSAEVNLRAAPGFDSDAVAAAWTEAMADLRTVLPALAAKCRDAEQFADFVEADSLALGAARRFVAIIRSRPAPPASR